jgi:hypothetical protein
MSLVPGNTAGINVITPKPGSGLTVQTVANVDTITTDNILQGTGIVLTRNTTNNTMTINSSALGSGVVSVTESLPQGSGVIVTSSPGPAVAVTVQGAYTPGQGISMTPSATPGNQTVTVANTMDIIAGAGITVAQAGPGQDATIINNVSAGNGISVTGTAPGGSKVVANTMTVAGSGAGIAVTQVAAGSNVTVANTGVTSIVAGSGVTISGATGAVTISASPTLSNYAKYYEQALLSGSIGPAGPSAIVANIASFDVSAMTGCDSFTFNLTGLQGTCQVIGFAGDFANLTVYLSDSPTGFYGTFAPIKNTGGLRQAIQGGYSGTWSIAQMSGGAQPSIFNTTATTLYLNVQLGATGAPGTNGFQWSNLGVSGWIEGRNVNVLP